MRIGILEAGHPPRDLDAVFSSYPAMIRNALGPGYAYRGFDLIKGDFPDVTSGIDAYVITGSASGVRDRDEWIARLREWLVNIDPSIPLIGICFGHQIMAEAYGGVVDKSRGGWATGLREYKVSNRELWMDDASSFVLPTFHRDQVVRVPPTARTIAVGEACQHAALSYIDRRAISFQAHPEFALDYTAMLLERCVRSEVIGIAQAELARKSMLRSVDSMRVIRWLRRFLDELN